MSQQRPRGALLAAVGSVLAVLGASAAVFVSYSDHTSVGSPEAAKWFADGATWASSTDQDGAPVVLTSLTWARGEEPAGLLPLPSQLYVDGQVADHPGSQLWTGVTAARYPDGGHLDVPEMFLASDEGVTQLVGFATVLLPVAFDPPVKVLPADVEEGRSWSQEGKASYGSLQLYDYRVESKVLDVGAKGCVVLRTQTTYEPTKDAEPFGATKYDDTVETTMCPGRWITGFSSSSGQTTAVTAADARHLLAEYEPPQLLDPLPAGERRQQPGRLTLHERVAASSGGADTLVVPGARVVVDSDVATNTVTAYVWDRDSPIPMWRLVGEGPTVVPPVSVHDTVVLADTHGVVTAVDAASGFVLWQRAVGRLPFDVAVDENGLYVAVLDRSGSAELLTLADGEDVTSVDAGDDPVGIAVATTEEGPVLAVADASTVRGYDASGDELWSVADTPSSGPVVIGDRTYVGTSDGKIVQIGPDGETTERTVGSAEVTDLVTGSGVLALLDDDDHFRLLDASDLHPTAVADDHGRALTLGRDGDENVFTTTALDGRITVYDATGTVVRHVRAPLTAPDGSAAGAGVQRPGAATYDGAIWASAVSGVIRWAEQ